MARLNNVFEFEVYDKSNSFHVQIKYVWSSIKRNFSFIKSQKLIVRLHNTE